MQACTYNNKTVKERFETIGKDFKLSCTAQIRYMNDVLDLLWIDTYRFKSNQVVVQFSTNWVQTLSLPFPIYDIEWRYARKSKCSVNSNIDATNKQCYNCYDSADKLMWIRMHDVWPYDTLDMCQFSYCRDSDEIHANIPENVESWFVRYYKYFNEITDLNDPIPVQPSLFPAIQMLMKVYYYEASGIVYDGDDSKYESRYNNFINKQKERDAAEISWVQPLSNEF